MGKHKKPAGVPPLKDPIAQSSAAKLKSKLNFKQWINSYPAASKCIARHGDLEALLDANNGLVKIRNFLPSHVADGVLSILENIPDSTWNMTSANKDYTHNNIEHQVMQPCLGSKAFVQSVPMSGNLLSAVIVSAV